MKLLASTLLIALGTTVASPVLSGAGVRSERRDLSQSDIVKVRTYLALHPATDPYKVAKELGLTYAEVMSAWMDGGRVTASAASSASHTSAVVSPRSGSAKASATGADLAVSASLELAASAHASVPSSKPGSATIKASSTAKPSSSAAKVSSAVVKSASPLSMVHSTSKAGTPSASASKAGTPSPSASKPAMASASTSKPGMPSPSASKATSSKPATSVVVKPSSSAVTSPISTPTASSATASPSATGLTSDQQAFLDLHNSFRPHYGASKVTWNSTLAAYAAAAAKTCKYGHTHGPYGENIAAGVGGGYNITTGFHTWSDESQKYNYSNPGYSDATGHFTQIVWKATTQIGCAAQKCADGTIFTGYGQDSLYLVCEYEVPGNWVDPGNNSTTATYFRENVGPYQA